MRLRRSALCLAALILVTGVRSVSAQAWSPRQGQGAVTFAAQTIDHVGRMVDDGTRVACCGTTNVTVYVEFDYGLTNRFSISGGMPYGFAKYRGDAPAGPAAFLPYPELDSCHCVHSSFQDFGFAARYNVLRVRRSSSVTATASFGTPSHAYEYAAEAAVGFGLKELGFGVDAAQRFDRVIPGLSLEGHYLYSVVQRSLDIRHDRSNARLEPGYDFGSHLSAHMVLSWQRTHGGLRFPGDVEPYPARYEEFHRLLQDNYFQAGAGASYLWRGWDLSAVFLRTVSGTNTHDVHVYAVSAGRSFRLQR
jgi:hypothetical protein